jgi:tetratricopeptide (TPR) repeat protein
MGVLTMIGNVDEWCNSDMHEYPYQAADGREALAPGITGKKCIRGGDWFTLVAQSGIRRNVPVQIWLPLWGFRVAVSSAIDEAGQQLEQTVGQMERELKKTYTARVKKAAVKGYAAWGQGLLDLRLYGFDRLQKSEQMFTKAVEAVQKASSKGLWRKRPDKVLGFPFYHIYYNRALARQELAKYEEALQDLTQAIELESSDADLFMLRAKTNGELGRWRAAETDLRRGLRLQPNHPFEREARIRIACVKQEWETALALLSSYIPHHFEDVSGIFTTNFFID